VAGIVLYLRANDVAVLKPAGTIAQQQQHVLIFASLLSLVVVNTGVCADFLYRLEYRVDSTSKKKPRTRPIGVAAANSRQRGGWCR